MDLVNIIVTASTDLSLRPEEIDGAISWAHERGLIPDRQVSLQNTTLTRNGISAYLFFAILRRHLISEKINEWDAALQIAATVFLWDLFDDELAFEGYALQADFDVAKRGVIGDPTIAASAIKDYLKQFESFDKFVVSRLNE